MQSHKKAKKIVTQTTEKPQAFKQDIANLDALTEAAISGDLQAAEALTQLGADLASGVKALEQTSPPERAILQSKSPARQMARRQRAWGRFNRLTIADILGDLREIQLGSNSDSDLREVGKGLFAVIEEARNRLLSLTGAPGIISQFELETVKKEIETRSKSDSEDAPSFVKVRDLVARYRAGWLVEAGKLKLCPSQNELICIQGYAEKNPGQFHSSRSAQTKSRVAVAADTPTPEQLQAWFDLPSDPAPAAQ